MDRVFLDANVLFSASYRGPSGVLWLWQRKKICLLTSDYAMEEARRNLVATDHQERIAQLMQSVEIVATPRPSPASAGRPACSCRKKTNRFWPRRSWPRLPTCLRATRNTLAATSGRPYAVY